MHAATDAARRMVAVVIQYGNDKSFKSSRTSKTVDESPDDADDEEATLLNQAPPPHNQTSSALHVIVACAYGFASVATTLANKALLSSWYFGLVLSLLFLQNLLTVIVVVVLKVLLPPSSSVPTSALARELAFPLWSRAHASEMAPVMLVCSLNLWAGMHALSLSSVPVYQTLKRMTPLPAMVLEATLRGKTFSTRVCLSVLVVCLGALLTGMGDLDLNARGYAFAIISCMLQALYLVLASRASDALERQRRESATVCAPVPATPDAATAASSAAASAIIAPSAAAAASPPALSSLAATYYNALLSLPILIMCVAYERDELLAFESWGEPRFLFMLVIDLLLGASLSLLLFACTLVNSALTTTIVGNAKAVATTILGAAIFGRVGLDALGWLGVGLNTIGGVLYSVAKYAEKKRTDFAPPKVHTPLSTPRVSGCQSPRRRRHPAMIDAAGSAMAERA